MEGMIHSKLRNRLSNDSINDLLRVKFSLLKEKRIMEFEESDEIDYDDEDKQSYAEECIEISNVLNDDYNDSEKEECSILNSPYFYMF